MAGLVKNVSRCYTKSDMTLYSTAMHNRDGQIIKHQESYKILYTVVHKIVMTSSTKHKPIVKPPVRKTIKAALSSSWVIIVFCVTTL